MARPSLVKVLGLIQEEPVVISLVGAGGKTTTLHTLGEELAAAGIPVLLTTTTHMRMEMGCDISGSVSQIVSKMEKQNPLLAGIPWEGHPDKLQGLPKEVFRQFEGRLPAVVVEADGAKCLPFKVPAAHEPAVPKGSTHILVLAGMSAIGQPLKLVCHRYDLAAKWLGVEEDFLLTPKAAGALMQRFYMGPLEAKFPNAQVSMLCSQADDSCRTAFAWEMLTQLKCGWGYIASHQEGELQCIRKYSSR